MEDFTYEGTIVPGRPTILMIPGGMGTSPAVYRHIAHRLECAWVILDWARSPGPWDVRELGKRLLRWVEEQSFGPVILAGYSAGGVIAMEAAIRDRAGKIAGLMLSNTGPCAIGHGQADRPQQILKYWFSREYYEDFLKSCFAFPIAPAFQAELMEYASQIPMDVVYEAAKTLREYDLRPELYRIHCPVTVAHGKLDKNRTLEHVRMLKEGIPQARVYLLHGGHTIMVDDPGSWLALLKQLMKTAGRCF